MSNVNEVSKGFAAVTEAQNLWNSNHKPEAIGFLQDKLNTQEFEPPDYYTVAVTLAEMYVDSAQYAPVITLHPSIIAVIKQVPEVAQASAFARLSMALGKAYVLCRNYDAAIGHFDNAAESHTLSGNEDGFVEATLLKATTLIRFGHHAEAVEACRIVRKSGSSRRKWTELNAVQALANAHLGNNSEVIRLAGLNMESFSKALGEGRFTALSYTMIALSKVGYDSSRIAELAMCDVDTHNLC
jgi:tetratricopeptide (TPR) repeat protein